MRDPRGTDDLAARHPSETDALRRLAETFVDLYPWLAVEGRIGIPPELRPRRAPR